MKRKAVQKLAIDSSLGKAPPSKHAKVSSDEKDLFELPPLPQSLETEGEKEEYYELPIHNMLYSGEIDVRQVNTTVYCNALKTEWYHEKFSAGLIIPVFLYVMAYFTNHYSFLWLHTVTLDVSHGTFLTTFTHWSHSSLTYHSFDFVIFLHFAK